MLRIYKLMDNTSLSLSHTHTHTHVCGVIVTVIENGHGRTSSNPGRDCVSHWACCGADKYVDPANELCEWEQPKQYEGTKVRW